MSSLPLVNLQNLRLSSSEGLSEITSLWLDPQTGKVIGFQDVFASMSRGVRMEDLGGAVVAPGCVCLPSLLLYV